MIPFSAYRYRHPILYCILTPMLRVSSSNQLRTALMCHPAADASIRWYTDWHCWSVLISLRNKFHLIPVSPLDTRVYRFGLSISCRWHRRWLVSICKIFRAPIVTGIKLYNISFGWSLIFSYRHVFGAHCLSQKLFPEHRGDSRAKRQRKCCKSGKFRLLHLFVTRFHHARFIPLICSSVLLMSSKRLAPMEILQKSMRCSQTSPGNSTVWLPLATLL